MEEQTPYSAPTTIDETSNPKRRPWVAVLLSLFGPVGHVYAGRARKAMCLWCVGMLLALLVAFIALYLPYGHISLLALLIASFGYPVFIAVDAFRSARKNRAKELKRYQRPWVYLLFVLAFAAGGEAYSTLLKRFIVEAFSLPSRNMSDTLLAGDRILVDKVTYHFHPIKRGDVVVFYPEADNPTAFVQRAVAIGGDHVQIENEKVFVNGKKIPEPYAGFEGWLPDPEDLWGRDLALVNYGPVNVPRDTVFVLGDNRRNSNDNRFLGPIPVEQVFGQARLIYWSREVHFPDPRRRDIQEIGEIRWSRIGNRIQ